MNVYQEHHQNFYMSNCLNGMKIMADFLNQMILAKGYLCYC